MGWIVPFINKDVSEVRAEWKEKLHTEKAQKNIVLVIVSIALLLDNMLYMVIVPIIPQYLEKQGVYAKIYTCNLNNSITPVEFNAEEDPELLLKYSHIIHNDAICKNKNAEEDESLGYLFASKAMLQLLVNPFSGTLIDKIGYEVPMMIGLSVMFFSTLVFAFGQSYGILFFARAIQGLGSAFADTSGLAMIADRFSEENERATALGIAIAFISFGSLVAPPFGGLLYEYFGGKPTPFFILAGVCLIDAILVLIFIHPKVRKNESGEKLEGTPIWRLFMDPYISICAGALVMANVSLAFLEPTIGKWMHTTMQVGTFQQGIVWFPAFFPHVGGVYFTIIMMRLYPQSPWILALAGLILEGVSCAILPFCENYLLLIIPLSTLCFGIALMDTAVLPLLGYLVDTRHVSVYGSVYAIADISYSLAYACGPIVAGQIVANYSFLKLNLFIFFTNIMYSPMLTLMRKVYHYSPVTEAAQKELDDVNNHGGNYGAMDGAEGNGEGPPGGQAAVEYQDTFYQQKIKQKPKYRGYKDTDAILGDEEDEYEDLQAAGGYQGGQPPYGDAGQGGVYPSQGGW